jgi:predicted RNase H-like HicB family nuclease
MERMKNTFTAIFERDGDGWIASVEELPGANTQGDTLDEARENLKDAVAMILEVNRELAEREIAGKQVVREELEVTIS